MSDLLTRLCVIILVLSYSTVLAAYNITDRYLSMGPRNNYQTRQERLLNFNTDTDGEISIEMQFAVPFIRIPVEKAIHATKGAVANVNVAALVVTAAIALMTGFVLPALLKLFSYKYMNMAEAADMPMGRSFKSGPSEIWRFLTVMDQALMENDLDTTSCMQKMVCYTVRESSNKVSNGLASSKDKIIDGIVTNEWISKLFDGTPVQSAIRSGLDGVNCSNEYSLCKLEQKTFANLVRQFANTINLT